MAPLATMEQLASRLQTDVGSLNLEAAERNLADSSGLVRAIGRQEFSFVSQETIELPGDTQILTLPQRPLVVDVGNPLTVVEVGEFGSLDLVAVEGRDYVRRGDELRRGQPYWSNTRLQGWPYHRPHGVWAPWVRVTYSHGYAVIPDDLVAIVLDVAQALQSNPTGLRSWSVPEYSETYATELLGAATVGSIKDRLVVTGRKRTTHSI
jgi:hypothetical protein